MSPLTWMLIGAGALAVLQLAVMGLVFLTNEIREARRRRQRRAVMAAFEQQCREQSSTEIWPPIQRPLPPPPPPPPPPQESTLPAASVHRAGVSDPPYINGVFSWLPRDRMN